MFCPRCGLKLNDFDSFCPRCGTQVKESDYAPAQPRSEFYAQGSPAPQAEFAPQQRPAPQETPAPRQQMPREAYPNSAYPAQPQEYYPQPNCPQSAYPAQPQSYAPQAPAYQQGYQPQANAYQQGYQPQTPAYQQGYQPQAPAYQQGYQPQANGYYSPTPAYPAAYPTYPYPAYPYPVYTAPVRPQAPPKPPKPNAKMRRAFNLTTLATLVTLAMQSVIVEVGLSIIGVVIGVWFTLTGQMTGTNDLMEMLTSVIEDTPAVFVFFTIYAVLYAIGMIVAIKFSGIIRKRVDAVAPKKRRLSAGQFIMIALVCFGFWGVGVIIGNVGNFVAPPETTVFGWGSIPSWILAVIGAPLFEETIFRKFVIDRLAPYGERTAVIFSALIFGMAHQNGMQFFLAFFVGIIFAIVYIKTGNLIYSMILHFMINLVATSDEIGCLIFGDVFDIGWMIVCGALMVAGLVTFFIMRKNELFRLEPNHLRGANQAAFKPWGVVLVRVLVCVIIGAYGAAYTYLAYQSRHGALSLLHLVPAVAAIVTIIVVSKKTSSKATPPYAPPFDEPTQYAYAGAYGYDCPAPQYAYAPQAQYAYAPQYAAPQSAYAPQYEPQAQYEPEPQYEPEAQYAPPEPAAPREPAAPVEPAAPAEPAAPVEPGKPIVTEIHPNEPYEG